MTPGSVHDPVSSAVILPQEAIPLSASEKINRNYMFKNYFLIAVRVKNALREWAK
jgi:hypothetical protein